MSGGSASDYGESVSRGLRKEIKYRPRLNSAIMDARMSDAAKHSIHPLVMAGIDPGGGGGFGAMPTDGTGAGIAEMGRQVGNAIASKKFRKLEEDRIIAETELLKARATDLGQKPPQGPVPGMPGQNATTAVIPHVVPKINPATQEIKKGEVGTHHGGPGGRQKGTGVKPLTNAITIGDQNIQFAVEDAADIMEDPAKIFIAAIVDRNNKGVQWRKAIRDYAGMAHPRDYKARNLAERVISQKILWGLAKVKRHFKIPRYMGR